MSSKNKAVISVCAKSLFSLFIGISMVAIITLTSAYYNNKDQPATQSVEKVQASSSHIAFPENKEMLDEMSKKLAKEAGSLANINTAAGE